MSKRQRPSSERAFTLIELLVACFVILILASLLVPRLPRFLDALYQTRTVNDIRASGTSWEGCGVGWFGVQFFDPLDLTDGTFEELTFGDPSLINLFQCNAVGDPVAPSPLLPELDAWGNPYRYFVLGPATTPPNLLVMVSCGADGICDLSYDAGTYPTGQTNNDIVWQNDCLFYYPG